jgi:hypothetical protein
MLSQRQAVACPICDSSERSPVRRIRDHMTLEWFQVEQCGGCGTVYVADPPPPADLGRFYENEMGRIMHTKPGRLFTRMRRVRIERDLRPLTSRLDRGDRVIDFGTGDGSVALALAEHGFTAAGTDLYDPSSWPHDLPYRQFDPSGAPEPSDFMVEGEPAAGIVLRHVLEHVPAPRTFLEIARETGVAAVMLIVPNVDSRLAKVFGSNWYYWEPPRHLTFFSPVTLRECARRAGFEVAELRTYGIDEVVTTLFRIALLRAADSNGARERTWKRLASVTRPTGMAAGLSSAVATPLANTVCHAVLVRR